MQICLMRHGIAVERGSPEYPNDGDRPLTPEGRRKTRAAAWGLRELGVSPGAILTSPHARCRETANIVADVLGVAPGKVRETDALLPDASSRELLEDVGALAEHDAVVLVGHEPALGELASLVLCGDESALDVPLKKAGACLIELRTGVRGSLRWLLPPRVLRAVGR